VHWCQLCINLQKRYWILRPQNVTMHVVSSGPYPVSRSESWDPGELSDAIAGMAVANASEPGSRDMSSAEKRLCVGCGFCCTEIICRTGAMIYGHYTSPCPALTWLNDRYVCELYVNDPARYEHFLEIGGGCCFPANPWREAVMKRN